MTYPSPHVAPSGQSRSKPARRATWLKTSIVSASIVATLAGTQGIAWLESRNALAAIATAATPVAVEVALAYPTATALAAAPPAEQPTGIASTGISLLALLPTPTAAPTIAVAAAAPVNPTDTPAPTPAPTATPAAAIVSSPAQSQAGSATRPLARSRSSR